MARKNVIASAPKVRKFTREQLGMHGIWKKAWNEGTVEIVFDSVADARKIRFDLYNSVRLIRDGKVFDDELLRACEECSIRIEGTTLTIRKKFDMPALQRAFAVTGVNPDEQPQPGDEIDEEAKASQEKLLAILRMQKEMEETHPEDVPVLMRDKTLPVESTESVEDLNVTTPRVTPFYTR